MTVNADRRDGAKLQEALAEAGRQVTRPRLLVFRILAETKDHLSADAIQQRTREQGDSVSRASVYRALKLLEDKGLVRRISMKEGPCRFECLLPDKERNTRCHFVCSRCKQIIDIEAPGFSNLLRRLRNPLKIEIDDYEVRLFGVCDRCAREPKDVKH